MFHCGGFVTLHVLVIKCRAWSGSKLFDTLMVFPKDFFLKMMVNLNDDDKKHAKLTRHKHKTLVKFIFTYHKDLGRDIYFKRNS